MTQTILFVAGTRPEVIKLAPVINEFRKRGGFAVRICATGQHREMLEQAFDAFDLSPDRELDLMTDNQSLAGLSSRAMASLEDLYRSENPQLVFVQGDTTTAMIAALGAFYRQIPVAHVEAGLRTNNRLSPFPEEINRRLIGTLADIHFAPTANARANLLNEGIDDSTIHVTGNTAIDALLMTVGKSRRTPLAVETIDKRVVTEESLRGKRLILITAHRRENHGARLDSICEAVSRIAQLDSAIVVFSVHYNPNVRTSILPLLESSENIHLTNPIDYATFARLMEASYLILTDSGGIQEEAPSLGRPVLVLRDTTERAEGLEAGSGMLIGTHTEEIVRQTTRLWNDESLYERMSHARNPFGDGQASRRIYDVIAARANLSTGSPSADSFVNPLAG